MARTSTNLPAHCQNREGVERVIVNVNDAVLVTSPFVQKIAVSCDEWVVYHSLKGNPLIIDQGVLDILELFQRPTTLGYVEREYEIDEATRQTIMTEKVAIFFRDHCFRVNTKFWSVQYHQYFENYNELLQYKLRIYQNKIFQNKTAYQKYKKVEQYLKQDYVQKKFSQVQPTLVHGDLIMHNLLIYQGKFSGLIDWEFAQYGDPFYDLGRVLYYQECAKDYLENHQDIHFEYDFTSRLVKKLEERIPYQEEKYQIIRSFYFVDTIIWALNQKNSTETLSNLITPIFF